MLETLEMRNMWYVNWSNLGTVFFIIYVFANISIRKRCMSGLALGVSGAISEKSNSKFYKIISNITLYACIETFIIAVVSFAFNKIFSDILRSLTDTGANIFGLVYSFPVLLLLICIVLWANPLKSSDHIAPALPGVIFLNKLGCACAGCCHGMAWPDGILNYKYDRCEVPIQFIEAIVALIIFIVLFLYRKKARPGIIYPLFAILYSGTRFFTEFLRGEANVFGPLKTYHILCIIGLLYGVLMLVIVVRFGDKITKIFEETTYFKKGKFHQRAVQVREEINLRKIKKEKEKRKRTYNKPKKKKSIKKES